MTPVRAGGVAIAAWATILAVLPRPAAARPAGPGPAAIDLRLGWLPSRTDLAMRIAAVASAQPQPQARPQPQAQPQPHAQPQPQARARARAPLHPHDRDLSPDSPGSRHRQVVFRFNIGFGLDGGQPSGVPLSSGAKLNEEKYYQQLEVYGFGDAVLGTRGLVAPNLNTYVAARFRFNQGPDRPSTAIPSVFNASGVPDLLIRNAYAEAHTVFHDRLLRPLFLRAGRQFHYGPAIIHFDGLTVGYDTRAASITLYAGQRVSMYGFDESSFTRNNGAIAGLDARVDLSTFGWGPLIANAGALAFDGHRHASGGIAVRLRRNVSARASARLLDGKLARENLDLRARISKVTTVSAELENRSGGDWAYDLLVLDPQYAGDDPRRFLNIGPPLPRLSFRVRAGTVLLHAIDLLLSGAGALEHAPPGEASAFSSSYLEGSAAFEVRLRRALRIGASALARAYRHQSVQVTDTPGTPDPLPAGTGSFGERSYYEGGLTFRYTTGVRQFSAGTELYGRMYTQQSPYFSPDVDKRDLRGGARFSVEGWAGHHLRLRGEYDLAFVPSQLAPELSGIQSLRVMAEGTF